jgi:hypothetical protein
VTETATDTDMAAELEAERQRQMRDRLLVREYAIKAHNDQDTNYETACIDGVNEWLGDHRVPKMYRTEAEARDLAAQAVRPPILSVSLTDQQMADLVTAFRRQGANWRARLISDLRDARDEYPALRVSYVNELVERLNAPPEGAVVAAEAAPELTPTSPAPSARLTAQVMAGLTVRLPGVADEIGDEQMRIEIHARIVTAIQQAVQASGAEILGELITTVHIARV